MLNELVRFDENLPINYVMLLVIDDKKIGFRMKDGGELTIEYDMPIDEAAKEFFKCLIEISKKFPACFEQAATSPSDETDSPHTAPQQIATPSAEPDKR